MAPAVSKRKPQSGANTNTPPRPLTSHLRVVAATTEVSPVRLVRGLHKRRERHEEHNRYEQKTDQHRRQQARERPTHDDGHEPGGLVEDGPERVVGNRRAPVPVHEPDDKGRDRSQKAGEDVQEGAQVRQRRPCALVPNTHRPPDRPTRHGPRLVLPLDPVVRRLSLHARSFFSASTTYSTNARREGFEANPRTLAFRLPARGR